MQPSLPIRPEPRYMEYNPDGDDGVTWTVNDCKGLKECFGIEESDLVFWHRHLCSPESRYWRIIKRIFGVIPSFGDAVEEEDLEDWDWAKLAKAWSIPEVRLREELSQAADHWKKEKVSRRITQATAPAADGVKPIDDSPRFTPHQDLAEEKISELLAAYFFEHQKSKSDRLFIANRIIELRVLFEDKNRRESARQLVNMELNLRDSEVSRALLKGRLEVLSQRKELDDKQSNEVQKIQDSLEKNEKAHTTLTEKYLKAAADIGEEEIEQGELRKVALGTASHLIEAQRQFHAKGDRSLIDGMFAADELVWLTTAIPLRPAQYRPDLVLRVNEAMRTENLWDANYKPTPIQREASRRMLKFAKLMADEEETPIIPEIDDAPIGEDDEETESAADTPLPEAERSAQPQAAFEPAPPREEAFMVMG